MFNADGALLLDLISLAALIASIIGVARASNDPQVAGAAVCCSQVVRRFSSGCGCSGESPMPVVALADRRRRVRADDGGASVVRTRARRSDDADAGVTRAGSTRWASIGLVACGSGCSPACSSPSSSPWSAVDWSDGSTTASGSRRATSLPVIERAPLAGPDQRVVRRHGAPPAHGRLAGRRPALRAASARGARGRWPSHHARTEAECRSRTMCAPRTVATPWA